MHHNDANASKCCWQMPCQPKLPWALRQVYYFSNGKVKPANRKFSAVRSDYTINLDAGYALRSPRGAPLSPPPVAGWDPGLTR